MAIAENLKTPKSKQTRAKILNTARDLFATKGFYKTTVKDITKAADLGYGTFYLYFKDKKNIFHALLERVEDELYTVAQGGIDFSQEYEEGVSSYRALREDLRAIFTSFRDNAPLLQFCKELAILDPKFRIKYEALRTRLIDRTRQVLEKSPLVNVDFNVAAVAIAGMIESVAYEWTNPSESSAIDQQMNLDDLLPTITKLYFKAVS
ncbi:MAG: TetR/AcrR family transcriptional regulator [Candidatus Melainabacteria bacterium]|nr:TetR/AcrR family transcriptional regulator [Candidatus Melainabacteria bacterium]